MNLFGGLKAQGEQVATLNRELEDRWDHDTSFMLKDLATHGEHWLFDGKRIDPRETLL